MDFLTRVIVALSIMLNLVLSAATASEETGPRSMDDFLWKNRPLLVFVPAANDTVLSEQRSALASQRNDLVERDVVVIEIIGSDVWIGTGDAPSLNPAELRARYGVDESESVVLLVGKDGGVKMRQSSALSAQALFAEIDAMPMRRREMRERP